MGETGVEMVGLGRVGWRNHWWGGVDKVVRVGVGVDRLEIESYRCVGRVVVLSA